jgi:putative FmdB family regulatory protein
MPIYEYRCTSCGHEQEYLQKLSDPAPKRCPKCSQETLVKMLTAAGFQLKGSGWYATDFKGSKKAASSSTSTTDTAKTESKGEGKAAASTSTSDAPASAPATKAGS